MSFTKVNVVFEKATIVEYTQVSNITGTLRCDNLNSSLSVPITDDLVIKPSCGDEIKYLLVNNDVDDKSLEVVPIEIKIKGMKTRLNIDYDQLITNLGLRLKDNKPLFSALSTKGRFIKYIEALKHKHLLIFHK